MISFYLENNKEINLKPVINFDKGENYYNLIDEDGSTIYLELVENNNTFEIIKKNDSIVDDDDIISLKLNDLYLRIIENKQLGIEDFEDELDNDKPYNPDSIRVDTKTFSLRQIYEMIMSNDIDLSPDFQRNFVWDSTRQSRLIESILLRIPLPMFYFSQDDDGLITVVDGLQRLTTIKKFMDNELKLRNLEYLKICEGKYYDKEKSAIDAKYFRYFNMTQIVVNVIDPQSPTEVKYDIFRRINTGGKPLNWQEIRNCLSKPNTRDLIRQMVSSPSFKKSTLGSIKESRMETDELALRYITFYDLYKSNLLSEYNGNMVTTLDLKVEELNKKNGEELKFYLDKFNTGLNNCSHVFGEFAFRKCKLEHLEEKARKQLINKALFISWAVILSDFEENSFKNKYSEMSLIKPLASKITEDRSFFNMISFGTNGKTNIMKAFEVAEQILKRA